MRIYDTLRRDKVAFEPLDPNHVRFYVCGPTVYDDPHIGNARPIVVFDVLYRLLQRLYPAEDGKKVTYVRNITDVDDKINAAALESGKHVLTEARMAMNAAEGRDMLAASIANPDLITQMYPHRTW